MFKVDQTNFKISTFFHVWQPFRLFSCLVAVVQDFEDGQPTLDTYDVEYGNIETHIGLGTIGSKLVGSGATTVTEIVFTPNPSIDVEVNVFMNALRIQDDAKDQIGFNNGVIET